MHRSFGLLPRLFMFAVVAGAGIACGDDDTGESTVFDAGTSSSGSGASPSDGPPVDGVADAPQDDAAGARDGDADAAIPFDAADAASVTDADAVDAHDASDPLEGGAATDGGLDAGAEVPACLGELALPGPPSLSSWSPLGVVAKDFDGDGIADVAYNLEYDYGLRVHRGLGDGNFAPAQTLPTVGSRPDGLVAADFNGDGTIDLAAAGSHGAGLVVWLGVGDGSFEPAYAQDFAITRPYGGVGTDFNGDGIVDLAFVDLNDDAVVLALGNGDGTFAASAAHPTGQSPTSLVASDFNGDGEVDLAATFNSGGNGGISVLLGDGSGGMLAASSTFLGGRPSPLAVGDVDEDGAADLVFALGVATHAWRGRGDGTFDDAVLAPGGGGICEIVDLDLDGHVDIVQGGSTVRVLHGLGGGTFTVGASNPGPPSNSVYRSTSADLDGDGRPDVLVQGDSQTTPYLSRPGGLLGAVLGAQVDFPSVTTTGDLDGDGFAEVVGASWLTLQTARSQVGGGFVTTSYPMARQAFSVLTADLDGNHRDDIVAFTSVGAEVFLSDAAGVPIAAPPIASANINRWTAGDLDGDGHVDLFGLPFQGNFVRAHYGRGDGTFDDPVTFDFGSITSEAQAADVNGDGIPDLVVGGASVRIRLGLGNRTFAAASSHASYIDRIAVHDLTGDGVVDIIGIRARDMYAQLLVGVGDGTFAPETRVDIENRALDSLVLADFDRDGRQDIVFGSNASHSACVLRGSGPTACWTTLRNGVVLDANRDGRLDIVSGGIAAVNLQGPCGSLDAAR